MYHFRIFALCRETLEETIFAQVVLAAVLIASMQSGLEAVGYVYVFFCEVPNCDNGNVKTMYVISN